MASQPQVTAGGPRQLVLVAALAGVLLLIVGLLVLRPLLAGSAEEQAAPPPVTAAAAPTTTTPQLIGPSTTVTPSEGAAGSVKDPFKPLVSAGSAAAATGSAATGSGATVQTGSPTATTAATGSTVAGAGTGTATTPGGGGTSAEREVTLVGISNGTARVTVDGTPYRVTEGERFAGSYRAVDINSECASFESATTAFTLCEGEAVLK